jgi:beta-lactam-binding protein with PASTA domain
MLPLRPSRSTVCRLALALLCVAAPVCAHAQVARPPTPNDPAPTTRTRPPTDVGAIMDEAARQQLVTVPDLSGRTVTEARRLLGSMGLGVGRVSDGPASTGEPGTVMQQQPRAGSVVAPRSDVRIWLVPARAAAAEPPPQGSVLSRPPVQTTQEPQAARVRVPLLVGRSVEDARGMLAQVTLEVASVGEVAADGTPGTIVRQSPRAGATVAPKSGVQLWIVPERQVAVQPQPQEQPAAPRLVRVPSVVGRTVVDAQRVIAASGLGAGPLAEAAGTSAPGTVSRQEPAAGASVAANTPVRLWLVPPARVGQVATRPDPVAPRPQPPAQRPPPAAQTPAAQPPAVQTPVPSAPPAATTDAATTPPVTEAPVTAPADSAAVPDVRRMRLDEARGALAAAGLAAAFDVALADSAGWMVSAQQPGPGARLASGGAVALLLDPPASASAPVAGTTTPQPPLGNGLQPSEAAPVVQPLWERKTTWIALAVLLVLAAAAAAAKMRAGKLPPVTTVSARLRMDAPARVAVEGAPFGPARLRFRMNPGRTVANVSAAGPLFVRKEVSGD